MANRAFIAFLTLIVVACAPSQKEESTTPTIENHTTEASGKLRFTTPLMGLNSSEHYILGFRLADENSRLILHSHFSGFHQEDGLRLEFYVEKEKLLVRIAAPGLQNGEAQPLFKIKDNTDIYLRVEIHNGTGSGARILIWPDQISYQGEVHRRTERIQLGNQIMDSEEKGVVFINHGRGPFWGIELTPTTQLLEARREAAYVTEDGNAR